MIAANSIPSKSARYIGALSFLLLSTVSQVWAFQTPYEAYRDYWLKTQNNTTPTLTLPEAPLEIVMHPQRIYDRDGSFINTLSERNHLTSLDYPSWVLLEGDGAIGPDPHGEASMRTRFSKMTEDLYRLPNQPGFRPQTNYLVASNGGSLSIKFGATIPSRITISGAYLNRCIAHFLEQLTDDLIMHRGNFQLEIRFLSDFVKVQNADEIELLNGEPVLLSQLQKIDPEAAKQLEEWLRNRLQPDEDALLNFSRETGINTYPLQVRSKASGSSGNREIILNFD